MNLARSSLKLFIANLTTTLITFLGIVYFSRTLGPSTIGIFFLFQALLGMLTIPADFGIYGALEKRLSEGDEQESFLSAAILLKLVPLGVITAGILLFQPAINDYLGETLAALLAVAIVSREFYNLSLATLRGELRVGETAPIRVVEKVIWVGLGTFLIVLGFGVDGLVYALVCGFGAGIVLGWTKRETKFGRPTRENLWSLVSYSRYNFISSVGGYVYNWIDVVLIGFFLTQADVGAYEVTWKVATVVVLLSKSIATALFPQMSRWDAEDALQRVEVIIPNAITFSLILVIPSFFGSLVLARDILSIVFGSEYAHTWLILIVFMVDKITEGFQVVLGRALQAINRPDLAARATVVGVVLNFVLNVVLILEFGLLGAAIATTIASLVGGVLFHSYYLSRFVSITVNVRELAWCTIAAGSMAVFVQLFATYLEVQTVPELLIVIATGALLYAVFLFGYQPLRQKVVRNTHSALS